MLSEKDILTDSVRGCLFGGAFGDALGWPVEFKNLSEIKEIYGEEGINFFSVNRYGKIEITDDTQMSLYTANGIILSHTEEKLTGESSGIASCVFDCYEYWYKTQSEINIKGNKATCAWVYNFPDLRKVRAPGVSCLTAIGKGGGSVKNPVNNSKGCGGVMRVSPVGCFAAAGYLSETEAALVASDVAALTHGHKMGYIPAAFLSHLIYKIIKDKLENNKTTLLNAYYYTADFMREFYKNEPCYNKFDEYLNNTVSLALISGNDEENIKKTGEGWVADEALAIALYCAIKYEGDFFKAIKVAANHSGDSDSTAAIAGNLTGAYLGLSNMDVIYPYLPKLEASNILYEISDDLVNGCNVSKNGECTDEKWLNKYVHFNYGL